MRQNPSLFVFLLAAFCGLAATAMAQSTGECHIRNFDTWMEKHCTGGGAATPPAGRWAVTPPPPEPPPPEPSPPTPAPPAPPTCKLGETPQFNLLSGIWACVSKPGAPPPLPPVAISGCNQLLQDAGLCFPSGAHLYPIPEPPGAYVLPSYLCGIPNASAGLQAALNAAAGGALWIPPGCIVNTLPFSWIPSNTTVACGVGATFHSTAPLTCVGPDGSLIGHGASNVTIEGCTFTAGYTNAAQGAAVCPNGVSVGNDPVIFYGGSNIIFTDNAVTNQFTGEGVLFDGSSNVTISNNYFAYNYNEGLQLSNCQNCNVTGNTSLDSSWDMEDAGPAPPGTSTGTWSNNVFSCDSTGWGFLAGSSAASAGWRSLVGGTCGWNNGYGCSNVGPPCSPGQYSGVTVKNNTITGPGASLLWTTYDGTTLINNTYTNGGHLTVR